MNAIEQTKKWVEEVIIGLNLCPFAKKPYEQGLLSIEIIEGIDQESQRLLVLDAVERILSVSPQKLSNMLLALPDLKLNFEDFYQWCAEIEDDLASAALDHLVQIVVFHPDFHFADTDPMERECFVNSSPYPTIHILRHAEVELASVSLTSTTQIHDQNVETLNGIRDAQIKKYFWWKNFV